MRVLDADGSFNFVGASAHNLLTDGIPLEAGGIRMIDLASGRQVWNSYAKVYRSNPWAWVAVNSMARGVSGLTLSVHKDDDGRPVPVPPSGASAAGRLAAALRNPIDRVSAASRWHGTIIDRKVTGNALWEKVYDDRRQLEGFRRIPWKHVSIEDQLGSGMLVYADRRDPANVRRILPDHVIHFGLWTDNDDPIAPSPFGSLQYTLALHDAVQRQLLSFFKNGAKPSAHVKVSKEAGKTERQLIREILQESITGVDNAGRVLVTSGDFQPMTANPDDTKVIELAKASRDEVLAVFSMPPPLAGVLEQAARANVVELARHYERKIVGGDATSSEEELTAQLIGSEPTLERANITLKFDIDKATKAPFEERVKAYREARYVWTLNELRALDGLDRIDHPDADMPLHPLNEAPTGMNPPTLDTDPEGDDDDDDD